MIRWLSFKAKIINIWFQAPNGEIMLLILILTYKLWTEYISFDCWTKTLFEDVTSRKKSDLIQE